MERPESADLLLGNVMALPMEEIKFRERCSGNGGTSHLLRVLYRLCVDDVRLRHVMPRSPRHGGVDLNASLCENKWVHLDVDEDLWEVLGND